MAANVAGLHLEAKLRIQAAVNLQRSILIQTHSMARMAVLDSSITVLLQWCLLALPLVHGLTVGVQPPSPTAARLDRSQVTDVYTLENFPRLKTLLHDIERTNPTTISMLTGDFLAPYLLSSIDKGR